jgi:hypothetical protein
MIFKVKRTLARRVAFLKNDNASVDLKDIDGGESSNGLCMFITTVA